MDQGKESLQGSNSYKKTMDTTSTDQEVDDQMDEQAGKETTAEFQKMETIDQPTPSGNKESVGTEGTLSTEELEKLLSIETEGMNKMNVEQAAETINQDEQLISPKESSSNKAMGMKKKRVREEEEDEDKEKKSKGDSSYADTCTNKSPTSLDLDNKGGESTRSPPGDQGL